MLYLMSASSAKARVAWETLDAAKKRCEELRQILAKERAAGTASADMTARVADAEAAIPFTATRSEETIASAIALLEKLVALQPTMERYSLCGSAYKREAMIAAACRKSRVEKRAITQMKERYQNSGKLGQDQKQGDIFYPFLNYIAADLILGFGQPAWAGPDAEAVAAARQSLATKRRDDPDFWSVVGTTELLVEALAQKNLVTATEIQMQPAGQADAVLLIGCADRWCVGPRHEHDRARRVGGRLWHYGGRIGTLECRGRALRLGRLFLSLSELRLQLLHLLLQLPILAT
jgi:hypothetical protein